jgi:hypothetical protein
MFSFTSMTIHSPTFGKVRQYEQLNPNLGNVQKFKSLVVFSTAMEENYAIVSTVHNKMRVLL